MMTPPVRNRVTLPVITPWHEEMGGLGSRLAAAPASSTLTASRAHFYPVYLAEPFTVAKAFWANGATVGTDSLDIGVYRMTDQATGRLDLIRSTGAVLSAGTVSQVQESGTWKVARVNLTSGGDSTDSTTYTTASVTLRTGRLYLMAVENSHGSDAVVVSGIAGGPTWTSRASTQFTVGLNRISLWSGVPTADYTGTIVISFAGAQTGATWALDEQSGVDTTTTDGVVQTAVGSGLGTTALATLAAFASANNATYGACGSALNNAVTPGAGFTELADTGAATPAQRIETEWRVDNDTTVDATLTSVAWGMIGAEIKADASAFVIPPSLPGNPNVYMGFSISGATATLLRTAPGAGYVAALGGLFLASAFPLPSSCIPTSAVATSVPFILAGFSSRTLVA